MTIRQLDPEQVRTMTLAEKDRWWLENIWRGDMPQLTLRSGLTGALLGGVLCLTNLYIGIKTGWSLGVGITSVIISFAFFKALSKVGLGDEMTVLENNAMQSCATAAGYMTGPLIASIPAYMMFTGNVIPMWQVITWVIALALLGVLFAFPLKRRFINDDQLDFPEGKACGVVLDGLHTKDAGVGIFKAKTLAISGAMAAIFTVFRSGALLEKVHLKILAVPPYLEDYLYRVIEWRPSIKGTSLRELTIGIETDLAMFAAGGLMGPRTGLSLILGGAINYFILAPHLIQVGIILPGDDGAMGYKQITMWALWGGVAMMASASIFSFLSKPRVIISAFKSLRRRNGENLDGEDAEVARQMSKIELPMRVFVIGIPVVGFFVVLMASSYFGMKVWLAVVAIPLVFVFALIGANSTGLTSITPVSALGKLTQLTYAMLAPGNIPTNLMTAGITAGTASNASNLLMDIKPGYMLGAKPRHQAMAHVIGAAVGTCVAVPVFYSLFAGDVELFGTEKMLLPSAVVWKAVADLLSQGLGVLHPTAQVAVIVGLILGVVFEGADILLKKRFLVTTVAFGLAFILPFSTSLIMGSGALTFWLIKKITGVNEKGKSDEEVDGENQRLPWYRRVFQDTTLCAGLVAGAAIMGILVMVIELKTTAG